MEEVTISERVRTERRGGRAWRLMREGGVLGVNMGEKAWRESLVVRVQNDNIVLRAWR